MLNFLDDDDNDDDSDADKTYEPFPNQDCKYKFLCVNYIWLIKLEFHILLSMSNLHYTLVINSYKMVDIFIYH